MKINLLAIPLLLVCLCITTMASAQRIYLDGMFNKTKQKKAIWYREVVQVKSGVSEVQDYYMTGYVYMKGYYNTNNIKDLEGLWSNVLRTGPFTYYYHSGAIQSKVNYKLGQPDGQYVYYYDNSKQVKTIGTYDMGNKVGLWREFYEDGQLKTKVLFHKPYGLVRCGVPAYDTADTDSLKDVDKPISGATDATRYAIECYDGEGDPIPCNPVNALAKFEKLMFSDDKEIDRNRKQPQPNYYLGVYLAQNLRYPQYAIDNGIDKVIYVCVYVRGDGSFSHFECYNPCEDVVLQMEALRVLSQMPKWSRAHKGVGPWRILVPVRFKWK